MVNGCNLSIITAGKHGSIFGLHKGMGGKAMALVVEFGKLPDIWKYPEKATCTANKIAGAKFIRDNALQTVFGGYGYFLLM